MTSQVFNMDCMEGMAQYPDKYFDLAVVDPPYGIGESGGKIRINKNRPCYELRKEVSKYVKKDWDNETPKKEYWDELFRVSKNQIVFGANYFTKFLPPSMGWIFWDKKFENTVFSDGEFIYTSFKRGAKKFTQSSKAETRGGLERIHPTQKTIMLYQWIYKNYLPNGGKVLDTHLGSGSNRIAADKAGNIDFTGYELDTDYYMAQEKRWREYKAQLKLFV